MSNVFEEPDFGVGRPLGAEWILTSGDVEDVQQVNFAMYPWFENLDDVKYTMEQIIEYEDDPELVSMARKVLPVAKKRGVVDLEPYEYSLLVHALTPTIMMSESLRASYGPGAEKIKWGVGKLFEIFEEGKTAPVVTTTRTFIPSDYGRSMSKEEMMDIYATKQGDPSWEVPEHWRTQWGWNDSWVS